MHISCCDGPFLSLERCLFLSNKRRAFVVSEIPYCFPHQRQTTGILLLPLEFAYLPKWRANAICVVVLSLVLYETAYDPQLALYCGRPRSERLWIWEAGDERIAGGDWSWDKNRSLRSWAESGETCLNDGPLWFWRLLQLWRGRPTVLLLAQIADQEREKRAYKEPLIRSF